MARNKYGGVNDMPSRWLANKENKRVTVLPKSDAKDESLEADHEVS